MYEYDDLGHIVAVTGPAGKTRRVEYNASHRVTAVVLPPVIDPEDGGTVSPRYEYDYDDYGNMSLLRDPKGRETRFTFDEHRRPVARTLPMGQQETMHYDGLGRLHRRVDFSGRKTELVYDGLGRVVEKLGYEAGATQAQSLVRFEYDADGRLAGSEDERGPTRYRYDSLGRATAILAPEGDVHYELAPQVDRRLRTWTDHTDVRYTHDACGRLTSVRMAKRNGVALDPVEETTYEYTLAGSRAAMNLPNGVRTEYVYDSRDRLVRMTHRNASNELFASYAYDLSPDGLRTGITEIVRHPGGELRTNVLSYAYDGLNRLIRESGAALHDASGYSVAYDYDLAGNRVRREATVGTQVLTTFYAYDQNDRLLVESNAVTVAGASIRDTVPTLLMGDSGTAEVAFLRRPGAWMYHGYRGLPYAYAAAFLLPLLLLPWTRVRTVRVRASRLSPRAALLPRCTAALLAAFMVLTPFDLAVWAYRADLYGALSTSEWGLDGQVTTYSYDANGALTGKVVTGADAKTVEYVYNLANRLARVTTRRMDGPDEIVETDEYVYTAGGFRVQIHTEVTRNGTVTFSRDRYRVVDSDQDLKAGQVLEEYDTPGGGPVRTYILGDDVIGQVDGPGASPVYFLYDGHGSNRQLVDASGEIVATYAYDGYGNLLGDEPTHGQPGDTSVLYAGEHFDVGLQQYDLRARYYDPSNGRFNRMDPYEGNLLDPPSLHKYAYGHNNPISGLDPLGTFNLVETSMRLAIHAVISKIVFAVLSPLIRWGAQFMPPWMHKIVQELTPSAFMVGVSVTGSWKFLSGTAALDFAISPHTWNACLFLVAGGALGSRGGKAAGSFNAYAGLVFNAAESGDYAGHSFVFGFDWNAMQEATRKSFIDKLSGTSASHKWKMWLRKVIGANEKARARLNKMFTGAATNYETTWSVLAENSTHLGILSMVGGGWNVIKKLGPGIAIGTTGAVTISVSFLTLGDSSTKYFIGYAYGWQLIPWPGDVTDWETQTTLEQLGTILYHIWLGNSPSVPWE